MKDKLARDKLLKALRTCEIGYLDAYGCCAVCPLNGRPDCHADMLSSAADMLQEYVDRCARYADEIMALREQPRWIPVTERLPAEGERVLAAVEGTWVGEAYRDMRDVWMRSYGTPWDASIGVSVTHWMPLPDAPREKELSCRDDT